MCIETTQPTLTDLLFFLHLKLLISWKVEEYLLNFLFINILDFKMEAFLWGIS